MKGVENRIRIIEISRRTGLEINSLISALKESGIILKNGAGSFLNRSQIKIISEIYVSAVRGLFEHTKKTNNNFSPQRKEVHKRFFSKFIPEIAIESYLNGGFEQDVYFKLLEKYELEYLFKYELDESLIRSYFYKSILKNYTKEDYKYFRNSPQLRLKLNLSSKRELTKLDLRHQIFSRLNFGEYHIFSSEEDHVIEAIIFKSFSNMSFNSREAKIKTQTNFSLYHEKASRINRKNTNQ